VIGRARPGNVRPWQLAAAITALRAAFPHAKVLPQRHTLVGCIDLVVTEPIEDLQNIESWWPRRLRIAFPVLGACKDESAVAELITDAVPRVERGVVVQIGLGPEPTAAPMTTEARPAVTARQRGPRIGRRVPAGELRRLRGS